MEVINKRRTGAGTNTTMINSLVVADMMTEESRKIYPTKNLGPNWELEATIKLKYKTIEALKELSNTDNSETYDQIVMRLIRAYGSEG